LPHDEQNRVARMSPQDQHWCDVEFSSTANAGLFFSVCIT
jgi:hypothetical protein